MREICSPRPVAHRGRIDAAPENTLPAFEAAVKAGCCVETDLRSTADGHIVLFHDDDLDRVCLGAPGVPAGRKIRELGWEELQKVRLPYAGHLLRYFPVNGLEEEEWACYPWEFDRPENILRRAHALAGLASEERVRRLAREYRPAFEKANAGDPRGEPILALKEFLLWVRAQPEHFFAELELKDTGLCPRVFRLLEETGAADRCILMSGSPDIIREILHNAAGGDKPKGLRLGANIRYCRPDILRRIEEGGLYEVGLNAGRFSGGDVRRFNARGVHVFSNLGDTPAWWREMQKNGVSAFKTNCAMQYIKWHRENAGKEAEPRCFGDEGVSW